MLALQAAAGNRAVAGLVQAKRERPSTDDSARIMQRRATRRAAGGAAADDSHVIGAVPGKRTLVEHLAAQAPSEQADDAGRALPGATLGEMERGFGTDLSSVRVHEGPSAAALDAIAYTRGEHLHFAPGRFDPVSQSGKALLGHELAHVMQQRAGRVAATEVLGKGVAANTDSSLEAEADRCGGRIAAGQPAAIAGSLPPGGSAAPCTVVQRTILPSTSHNTLVRVSDPRSPHSGQVGRVQRVWRVDSTATVSFDGGEPVKFALSQLDYELVPATQGKDEKRETEKADEQGGERKRRRVDRDTNDSGEDVAEQRGHWDRVSEKDEEEGEEEESDEEFDRDEARALVDELKEIHRTLNAALRADRWAFTGSFALYLWSEFYHVPFHRKPDDYDVVVPGELIERTMKALFGRGYQGELPYGHPKPRYQVRKGQFKVDVMRSGADFASLDAVASLGQFRVTTLEQLEAKKHTILRKWPRPHEREKAEGDLVQINAVKRARRSQRK
jgi:hypothetical protein